MELLYQRHRLMLAWLGVMLFLLIPYLPSLHRFASVMDEGTLLVYPELILEGFLPYRDFETFYGPANVYLLAGCYSLLGCEIGVERAVAVLYRLAAVSAMFCLLRRSGLIVAVGGALLSGFMLVPLELTASAWVGGVVCAMWSLVAGFSSALRWRASLAGVLAAGALLFRPDLGPAVFLSAVPLLLTFSGRERWRWGVAFAVGLFPLAALAIAVGPAALWNSFMVYPVTVTSPGRRLPLSFAEAWLVRLLVLHVVVSLFNLTAGARLAWADRARWSTQPQSVTLLAGSLLGFGMTHQLLQRLDIAHFFGVAFVAVGIASALAAAWMQRLENRVAPSQALLAVTLPLVCLLATSPELSNAMRMALVRGLDTERLEAPTVENAGRRFPVRSQPLAADLAKVVAHAEMIGRDGQRLFVGPADLRRTNYVDTFLYHLFPRFTPATYFLEMNPLSANRPGSRLASDLASADLVILNTEWDQWGEPNESQRFGPEEPNLVLARQFEQVAVHGTFLLYRKNSEPPR